MSLSVLTPYGLIPRILIQLQKPIADFWLLTFDFFFFKQLDSCLHVFSLIYYTQKGVSFNEKHSTTVPLPISKTSICVMGRFETGTFSQNDVVKFSGYEVTQLQFQHPKICFIIVNIRQNSLNRVQSLFGRLQMQL